MFDNIMFSSHASAKLSPFGGFPLDSLAKSVNLYRITYAGRQLLVWRNAFLPSRLDTA